MSVSQWTLQWTVDNQIYINYETLITTVVSQIIWQAPRLDYQGPINKTLKQISGSNISSFKIFSRDAATKSQTKIGTRPDCNCVANTVLKFQLPPNKDAI